MIKAIFFDIDGTLLSFESHAMPDSTREALEALHKNGIKLFLASGRGKLLVRQFDAMGLFDGAVLLNGQLCLVNGRAVHRALLDPADVRIVLEDSAQRGYPILAEEEDTFYIARPNAVSEAMFRMVGHPPAQDHPIERALDHDVFKIIAYLDEAEERRLLARLTHTTGFRWYPTFTDLGPRNGGKNIGIDKVLESIGVPLAQTMAFGDGSNDKEMLAHVGLGVAMGNAAEEVRARADYVTDTVDGDGVAKALRRFELI